MFLPSLTSSFASFRYIFISQTLSHVSVGLRLQSCTLKTVYYVVFVSLFMYIF